MFGWLFGKSETHKKAFTLGSIVVEVDVELREVKVIEGLNISYVGLDDISAISMDSLSNFTGGYLIKFISHGTVSVEAKAKWPPSHKKYREFKEFIKKEQGDYVFKEMEKKMEEVK